MYGFVVSFQKTRDTDFPSGKDNVANSTTMECKKQEKSKKMNVIAISNLTADFTSESLIGIVHQARKTKWPSGL